VIDLVCYPRDNAPVFIAEVYAYVTLSSFYFGRPVNRLSVCYLSCVSGVTPLRTFVINM
jgi:hypothetical protein